MDSIPWALFNPLSSSYLSNTITNTNHTINHIPVAILYQKDASKSSASHQRTYITPAPTPSFFYTQQMPPNQRFLDTSHTSPLTHLSSTKNLHPNSQPAKSLLLVHPCISQPPPTPLLAPNKTQRSSLSLKKRKVPFPQPTGSPSHQHNTSILPPSPSQIPTLSSNSASHPATSITQVKLYSNAPPS